MAAACPVQPINVCSSTLSGHAHRVRLFLSPLGLPLETVEVDLRKGEQRSTEFLRRNAFGQVPVIEDGEVTLADSNAILIYLNERYAPEGAVSLDTYPRVRDWLARIEALPGFVPMAGARGGAAS